MLGLKFDWYKEIKILAHLLKVIRQKQHEFTLEVLTNPDQKLLPLSPDTDYSLLSATDNIDENFEKIYEIFCNTRL